MEDEEETPPSSPAGRITVSVAAPCLAIALPAQLPRSNGYGAVGSREDCWSEDATSALIEAWGERYLQLSRGNLKQQHWKEVADVVSSMENSGKVPKTDVQCKNRIDTVKKKFKSEKAKIAAGGPPSLWRFYNRLDELIGPVVTPSPGSVPSVRSTRIQNQKKRKSKVESDSEPDPPSPDSTDSLPPETKYPYKRARSQREFERDSRETYGERTTGGERWGDSVRELTRAIVKFGEMYENAERSKLEQMVEMEKQRMKFAKELEVQRMQFFMKTQLEFSQRNRNRNNNNNNNHHNGNNINHRHRSNNNNHNNDAAEDDHHSDSSS